MKLSKRIARGVVAPTLIGLGCDKLIRRVGGNRLLNILYHGVVEQDATYFSPRSIEKGQFERQLRYIKRHFNVISLEEAFQLKHESSLLEAEGSVQRRRNSPSLLKRPTVTISFDDGFKNNLTTALPIIEKYQLPVTFFVSSALLVEQEIPTLWSEKMAALRYFAQVVPGFLQEDFAENSHETNIPTEGTCTRATLPEESYLMGLPSSDRATLPEDSYLKGLPPSERDALIDELVGRYSIGERLKEIPEEVWKLMTPQELRQLASSPYVEIGSHGHLHYNLGEIPLEEARKELCLSRQLLGEALQREIKMVAYPDGSYSKEVKKVAGECGYSHQLAVNYLLEEDWDDPSIMDRYGISSTTTFESNMISLNLAYSKRGVKL